MSESIRTAIAEFGEDPALFARARRTLFDVRQDITAAALDRDIEPVSLQLARTDTPGQSLLTSRQAWKSLILERDIEEKYMYGVTAASKEDDHSYAKRLDSIKKFIMAKVFVDDDLNNSWLDVIDDTLTFGESLDPSDPGDIPYIDNAFMTVQELNETYEAEKGVMNGLTDELVIMNEEQPDRAAFFAFKALAYARNLDPAMPERLEALGEFVSGAGYNAGIGPGGIARVREFVATHRPQNLA